jgi:hypothetical protein
MLLRPKNWAVFQHYKDRLPPWIKLHRDLLTDRKFMCLPIASKALAPMLWLLASENESAIFDGSLDELQFRLHISKNDYDNGIKPLIDNGFFEIVSGMLADCKQVAIPEREIETETKKETKKKEQQRGSRLPTDWVCPNPWAAWARTERPDLNITKVAEMFYDYWISRPGAGGVKLNWEATWRNWVRSQKQPFVKPQDVVHQTTPTPANHDAALRKIEEDRKKASKPNAEVQARIAELLKGKVV